jgi:hypothetical protein
MRARHMGRSSYWKWHHRNRSAHAVASVVSARAVDRVDSARRTGKEAAVAVWRGLLNVTIAAILLAISHELPPLMASIGSNWTGGHWLEQVGHWLEEAPVPPRSYTPALAAALGVVGTLSGVYFATVAFVISSSYKQTTSRVRDLVTQLPASTTYTFIFTQAVLFTLGAFAMPLVQTSPTRLTLFAVVLMSAFVVIAFSQLRQQLYRLLDPLELLAVVERHLKAAIAGAMKQARRKSPSQARMAALHKQAADALETVDDLARLMLHQENDSRHADEAPREDPRISGATKRIMHLWADMTSEKPTLKTLDGWNPLSYTVSQRDWFLAEPIRIRHALDSRTPLGTVPTADVHWLEKGLTRSIELMVSSRSPAARVKALGNASPLLQTLMQRGQFEEANIWRTAALELARLPNTQGESRPQKEAPTAKTTLGTTETNQAIVDLYVSIWLAEMNGLNEYAFAKKTNFPRWAVEVTRAGTPTLMSPSAQTLSRNLHDSVAFESAVDRTAVTPDINLAQLMAREISNEAHDQLRRQLEQFTTVARAWLTDAQQFDISVAGRALMRFDQCLQQSAQAVESVRQLMATCELERRDVDDRWPVLDISDLMPPLSLIREEMKSMVSTVASRADASPPSDAMDLFGWAYHRTLDDLLNDVLEGKIPSGTTTDERIRDFLVATASATRRMIAVTGRVHPRTMHASMSGPAMMFLRLSAAAMLISEVKDEPRIFEPFKRSWDERMPDAAAAQSVLDGAVFALDGGADLYEVGPRSIVRTEVGMRIEHALRSLGIPGFMDLDDGQSAPEVNLNESTRRLLQHVSVGDHFESLFVAAHLIPAATRAGATLGHLDSWTASIYEHLSADD